MLDHPNDSFINILSNLLASDANTHYSQYYTIPELKCRPCRALLSRWLYCILIALLTASGIIKSVMTTGDMTIILAETFMRSRQWNVNIKVCRRQQVDKIDKYSRSNNEHCHLRNLQECYCSTRWTNSLEETSTSIHKWVILLFLNSSYTKLLTSGLQRSLRQSRFH